MNQDKLKLFASTTFDLVEEQKQNLDIKLEQAETLNNGSVTGTVYDTTILTGNIVPGATVKVFTDDGTPFMHTITKDDGTFTINDLPLGTYTITAVKDGNYLSVDQPLIISNVIPVTINLAITPTTISNNVIYGKILNFEDNTVINDADVILYKMVDNVPVLYAKTKSISDGEYIIDNIEDGLYQISVQKTGYQTNELNNITLENGVKLNSNITLVNNLGPINSTVSGFIKDELGNNVQNVLVALYKIDNDKEVLVATTYTNSIGKYMFGNVVAGNYMVKAKLTETV